MKNLLLIFAFVLICSTGFSQTFSYSSGESGSHIKVCNVTVTNGGYNYSYSIYSYGGNTTSIGSPHLEGYGANLTYGYTYQNSKSGSGNTGSANSSFTSDAIYLVIVNSGGSGSASITISCY